MWIYVGIGGAFGALSRYGISLLLASFPLNSFPMATFLTNMIGSFLLGFAAGSAQGKGVRNERLYTGLTAGFIGSFTTFSTFSVETIHLLEEDRLFVATIYVLASVVFGLATASVGNKLGKRNIQIGK